MSLIGYIFLLIGITLAAFGIILLHAMIPVIIGIVLSIFGGILWAVAWIVEGFVRGPKIPQQ